MVGEQHDDVRGGQAVVEIDELGSAVVGNIGGQRGDEWLDYQDLSPQAPLEVFDYRNGRAFAQVGYVGLVGESEADDDGFVQAFALGDHPIGNHFRHPVVDLSRSLDQRRQMGCGVGDEPRIDGDAVPPDSGSGT